MTIRYLIITSLVLAAAPALAQATFQGLGFLPDGGYTSEAKAVSPDGSAVVGQGNVETATGGTATQAFMWTETGGMTNLGDLSGGADFAEAYGVSGNGDVVVGYSSSSDGYEAFRWEDGTMVELGNLPGGGHAGTAYAVSSDGSVLAVAGTSDGGPEAFIWTESSGFEALGNLPGGTYFSRPYDISSNGSAVVGWSNSGNGNEGFIWSESAGMAGVGDLPGGTFDSRANGISGDGSVVVGRGRSDSGYEAFRWTDGTISGLGNLPGGDFESEAFAVSGIGSVVVGTSVSSIGDEAFIWMEETGMRNLKEVLEDDYGLDLTGWTLESANGISDDGTVIVGAGWNPSGDYEAWRAEAPFTVAEEATPAQLADRLTAPIPDPVRGTATFSVAVENSQNVTVEVFDTLGRRVRTLYDAPLAAGMSEALTLDASALPTGVYVVRAAGEEFVRTRRVTVVR